MPIQRFTATNFRCLGHAELDADPGYNLIYGPNASGKTSILEAIAYLGRGKSFRGAATADLIRHGEQEFVLFGEVLAGDRTARVGVRNNSDGLQVRVDGEGGGGAAALAAVLPVQIIDPDVHGLVAGAPEQRRRYLDWLAFHVEHGYLDAWRRFRRVLRQRNAALRSGAAAEVISGWDTEFAAQAAMIDRGRRAALMAVSEALQRTADELLQSDIEFSYQRGWSADKRLSAALEEGVERDRQLGNTQLGPHRADLRLSSGTRRARRLVSRGQEKLLACAMVLAATEAAQTALEQPVLLLLDDPAAELDSDSLQRLMRQVAALGCQVVATSLEPDERLFAAPAALFHVEHGRLSREV